LEAANLVGDFQEEASEDVQEGRVTRSTPAAGEEVAEESTVTVFLSTGPGENPMPDLVGRTEEDARSMLADLDITRITTEEDHNPDFAAGEVTATDPIAGTSLTPTSRVVLKVASGKIQLPNFVGATAES